MLPNIYLNLLAVDGSGSSPWQSLRRWLLLRSWEWASSN